MNTYKIEREPDSLYHHGVKNMKWGIRRYQNEDGSYKPGAEGRYSFGKISGPRNTAPSLRGMPQLAGSGSGKKTSITAGKTYDGKKIGGGGGGSSVEETEEKEKIDRKNIHIYDVSEKLPEKGEKKKTGGKGSGSGKSTGEKAAESEKNEQQDIGSKTVQQPVENKSEDENKNEDVSIVDSSFKPDSFYDRIKGLELDDISRSDRKELDDLIKQYNIYKQQNSVSSKKKKEIEEFISRYEKWKNERKVNLNENGISPLNDPKNKRFTNPVKKRGGINLNENGTSPLNDPRNKRFTNPVKRRNRNVNMKHSEELYHFGILGMKWGIRRYQNPDGSYTAEGKRRKSKGKEYSEDYWNAHDKKDPKYMSDKELQQRINRLNNEKQYKALTKSNKQKAAEEAVKFGKRMFSAAVGTVLIGMAAKYGKEHVPEIVNSGKDFVQGSAWMMEGLLNKIR